MAEAMMVIGCCCPPFIHMQELHGKSGCDGKAAL